MILYKKDTKGNVRFLEIKTEGADLVQISGVLGTDSPLPHRKTCKGKNIGKSNETTPNEQANLEMLAKIKDKLTEGYFKSIKECETEEVEFRPMKGLVWEDQKIKPKFPLLGSYKMDGACAYAYFDGSGVVIRSFTGELWVACPHINKFLEKFFDKHPEVILHGEFYNHLYNGRFNELMSLIRQQTPSKDDLKKSEDVIQFHIHDMFNPYYPKITAFKRIDFLKEHKGLLQSKFINLSLQVKINNGVECDNFHHSAINLNYEGTVFRPDIAYTPNKKGKGFFKRKDYQDAEFELIDFMEGVGNWSGKAKRAIVKMPNGKHCGVGVSGDYDLCEDYLINKYKYIGKMATVKFLKFTPDGLLREGILKDIGRPD